MGRPVGLLPSRTPRSDVAKLKEVKFQIDTKPFTGRLAWEVNGGSLRSELESGLVEVGPDKYFNVDSDSGALIHCRRQTQTGAERIFLESLLPALNAIGFRGEVATQPYLVCPLQKRLRGPLGQTIQRQLKALPEWYQRSPCTLRRPDILITKAGVAIEIDGGAHDGLACRPQADSDHSRLIRDATRDPEYLLLGIYCYRVENWQVFNPEERSKRVTELVRLVQERIGDPSFSYGATRTAICRARADFKAAQERARKARLDEGSDESERKGVDIGSCSGSRSARSASEFAIPVTEKWGGTAYVLGG